MDALSLDVFEARLNGALSNLVQWKMPLLTVGAWNWVIISITFNLNHSDSMILNDGKKTLGGLKKRKRKNIPDPVQEL